MELTKRCFLSKENREKLLSECFVQKIRTVMTKGRSCEITPFQYAATVNNGNRNKFTLSFSTLTVCELSAEISTFYSPHTGY